MAGSIQREDREGRGGGWGELPGQFAQATWRQGISWWMVLDFGAQVLVLMLAPSSYRRAQRRVIYRQLHAATLPGLPVFMALSMLLSVIIIRIVLVTAASYGLSQYALDVLIRTLVIELLPLFVALYVALRYSMPAGEDVAHMRRSGRLRALWQAGGDPARDELMPRVLGGLFAITLLAAIGCVQALVLTYLMVYGFTNWGLATYTRAFGQTFTPAVTLIFCMKTFFFSLAVAIMPIAPYPRRAGQVQRQRDDLRQLGRLFTVVLLIEVASLIGTYS